LTSARTITERVRQPRAVFLDVPLGHTSGPPGDREMQRHVVCRALELATEMMVPPTIENLDLRWHHDDWKSKPLSWNRTREDAGPAAESGASSKTLDTRTPRTDEPQYQTDEDRRAAVAVDPDQQCLTCIGLQPMDGAPNQE
jgi:hypothetical protein